MRVFCTALVLGVLFGLKAGSAAESTQTCSTPGGIIYVVHLEDDVPPTLKLTASVAAGLVNRHFQAPTVLTLNLPNDQLWLASAKAQEPTMSNCTWESLPLAELWQLAYSTGAAVATVVYDPSEPWSLATVVTFCGVHRALPVTEHQHQELTMQPALPVTQHQYQKLTAKPAPLLNWLESIKARLQLYLSSLSRRTRAFAAFEDGILLLDLQQAGPALDARGMWADSFEATNWAYHNLFNQCNQTHEIVAVQVPGLMQQGLLADFIVACQLFALWLPDLCEASTPAYKLYQSITDRAWEAHSLLTIVGYFAAQEAIAACSWHHTELALVSDWSPNLSFWSQMTAAGQLHQAAALPIAQYSGNKTYVAVIVSDGDSLQMDYNNIQSMMEERGQVCEDKANICPPVSWTISNRLADLAPFVLAWHYRQAALRSGKDSFLMGPSGYGFLHPSAIAAEDPLSQTLANLTAAAAVQLDMTAYVHWDDYDNAAFGENGHPDDDKLLPQDVSQRVSDEQYVAAQHEKKVHLQPAQLTENAKLHDGSIPELGRIAMEHYISRFEGTSIQAVFSPIMPYVSMWIGNIATFRELIRWTDSRATSPAAVAQQLMKLPQGSFGYVYKLPDIRMHEVEALARALADTHVELVGHREIVALARQARAAHSKIA